ncbi:MAG TPA: Gfo/Idh/MocA family oxidoreductase [Candidatus Binatia bacterium]
MTDILRMGFAGLSMDATKVLTQVAGLPNIKLAAAADAKRTAALDRFSADFGAETYDSIEKLCQSPHVDAVYIATPPELHAQHAIIAARHRKHVIVEKPMALTLDDADRMNEMAEKYGVKLLCGHTHSFDAPVRKMREIVRSGDLGKLCMVNTWNYNEFMYRRFTDQDLAATHGIVLNQMPHQVDIVRLIGGGMVKNVRAVTGVWDWLRTSEGASVCFLQFEDGVAATIVYNGRGYFDTAELFWWIGEGGQPRAPDTNLNARTNLQKLAGTDREAQMEDLKEREMRYGAKGLAEVPAHHGWEEKVQRPARANVHQPFFGLTLVSCEKGDIRQSPDGLTIYGEKAKKEVAVSRGVRGRQAEFDELYEAIFNNRPLFHNGRWGEATLEVCLGILESARSGKELTLSHQVSVHDAAISPI